MEPTNIDEEVAGLLAEEQVADAVGAVLEVYGPRIFRMMIAVVQSESVAEELYQAFSISLWKSLPSFRGDSGIYTWAYRIARRTIGQHLRKSKSPEQRLHTREEQELAAGWTRTATADWRKTESRDRFRELVEELDPDDRTLVMLRIGESMPWSDIANVLADEPLSKEEITKASARLRKRFERVKERLKTALESDPVESE